MKFDVRGTTGRKRLTTNMMLKRIPTVVRNYKRKWLEGDIGRECKERLVVEGETVVML